MIEMNIGNPGKNGLFNVRQSEFKNKETSTMNTFSKLTMMMAMAAIGAFANDHLVQIRDHARDLEQDFRGMHSAVKSKKINQADLQARLDATAVRLEELKSVANEFAAANPELAASKDGKLAQDLVALIAHFHDQKSQLVEAGAKNKGLLKTHAEGLAKRASMLRQVAERLAASSGV